jgi:hypothetical protein
MLHDALPPGTSLVSMNHSNRDISLYLRLSKEELIIRNTFLNSHNGAVDDIYTNMQAKTVYQLIYIQEYHEENICCKTKMG